MVARYCITYLYVYMLIIELGGWWLFCCTLMSLAIDSALLTPRLHEFKVKYFKVKDWRTPRHKTVLIKLIYYFKIYSRDI